MFVALLAIGINANAQWIKSLSKDDPKAKEVSYYIIDKDTIAKKWIDLPSGEKFTSTNLKSDYYSFLKVDDYNYLTFAFENSFIPVVKGTNYDVVVLMNDYSTIKDSAYVCLNEDEIEIVLHLSEEDVEILKTQLVDGIKIQINDESNIIDSKDNDMKSESIKKMANIIWPDII